MELKPCPFCGAKVEIEHDAGSFGWTPPSASIKCPKCKIGFKEDTQAWKPGRGHYSAEKPAVEELIERWNTRS